MRQLPSELNEAIRLQKEGDQTQSREVLRNYLVTQTFGHEALLWLAKVSCDPRESLNAAELSLALDPENEVARRAVASVSKRISDADARQIELDLLKLTGMTEVQARAVNWPFRNVNKPIGILMDEKSIGLRDLAWAMDNAYDDLIPKACRTLLLSAIFRESLSEPVKPIRLIQGRENLEYHERIESMKAGLYMGIAVTLLIVFLLLDLTNRSFHFIPPIIYVISFFLIVVLAIWMAMASVISADEMINYKTGRRGEARAIDFLRASLYSPWVLVHSFEWLERKWGDADLVLVGSGGMWVFEVKSYTSKVRVIGEKWQYKSRFGWRTMGKNPGRQAQRTAMRMKDYLENHDIRMRWVQPVVLWAGEDDHITLEEPAVPVWRLGDMDTKIEELWRQQKLPEDQIKPIVDLLESTLEKVRRKN